MATRFTTKAMIIDGIHYKAKYSLSDDGKLTITATAPDGSEALLHLDSKHELYQAARMAYEIKVAKRAGAVDAASLQGLRIKGRGYEILMDGSIDRATVTFKTAPSKAAREAVKAAGFWYTPSHKCWSRKLNNEAWIAAQLLHQKLA